MSKTVEELAAEERKEYFKAWRAANKERTAEHRRRYWEKRALARLAAESGEVQANDTSDSNDQ
jgi:hypothetical protein